MPGGIAGKATCLLGVRGGVLDDDLRRRVDRPTEHLGRPFLIPGQPTAPALALEQELVLAPGGRRGEEHATGCAPRQAEQQRRVVLQWGRCDRVEHGEDLADVLPGHVLGEVEPVRSEVADDVGGA